MSFASNQQDHSRVPALDGIRGFAVLWVMLHHFLAGATHHNPLLNGAFAFARYGYWGVDVFFVLSGFLITGILYDARKSDNYFAAFYARRSLRIFPLYYCVLAGVFVLTPLVYDFTAEQSAMARHQWGLWAYVGNIVMVVKNAPIYDAGGIKLLHFWSLAIEEQFYLVWPAVVLLFSRRTLLGICGGLVIVAAISRIMLERLGINQPMASFFTLSRVDGLALGAMAALLARGPGGLQKWVQPSRLGAGLCALGLAMALFAAQRHWLGGVPQNLIPPFRLGLFVTILVLAVAAPGWSRWGLSARWLRFLGKYSYALYVFHYLLMPLFDRIMPRDQMTHIFHSFVVGAFVRLAVCMAISIVVALASWHLLEKHFLAMKHWFAPRREKSPRPAVVTTA